MRVLERCKWYTEKQQKCIYCVATVSKEYLFYAVSIYSRVPSGEMSVTNMGTTGEIISSKEEDEGGVERMRLKVIGRQRFRVMDSHRQLDGYLISPSLVLRKKEEKKKKHPSLVYLRSVRYFVKQLVSFGYWVYIMSVQFSPDCLPPPLFFLVSRQSVADTHCYHHSFNTTMHSCLIFIRLNLVACLLGLRRMYFTGHYDLPCL